MKKVKAFAPATVANVACGFDVLGLALDAPGDTVAAELVAGGGVTLASVEGDGGRLSRDVESNTAGVAARHFVDTHAADHPGIRLSLKKGLPLASGMGSSAASAVAAVVAVNRLLELDAPKEAQLESALAGETLAAGAGHADNAAASLYGGFVLVRSTEPPDVLRLPVPGTLSVALVRPHLEVATRDSRLLLGTTVELENAVKQWANVGALVAGLYAEDWELVSRSLVDHVAEPVRAQAVPGFDAVRRGALDAGALGCSLSGSGPSMFALCRDSETADAVADRMVTAFGDAAGVEADRYASPVSADGARILEQTPCDS